MKWRTKNHVNKIRFAYVLLCITILGLLTGCKEERNMEDTPLSSSNNMEEELMGIEEFINMNTLPKEQDVYVTQPGNYKIGNVELSDAVEAPETVDTTWMGYSEVELGFLSPEEMPNCEMTEYGFHTVMYNGILYFYINEYNEATGDPAFQEYADVWGTKDMEGNISILGNLEEYGKYRAKEGDSVE